MSTKSIEPIALESHPVVGQESGPQAESSQIESSQAKTLQAERSHDQEVAKRSWVATFVWLLLTVAAFAGGKWYAETQARHAESIQLPPEQAKMSSDALPVTVAPIGYQTVERSVRAVGTLHGYEEIALSSKVEGRVTKIYYDLSSRVKPGDLLIEVDKTDASLAVAQAERNLQAELAKWGFDSVPEENEDLSTLPTVVSARVRYELARTQLQRIRALRASNSIAQEELEKSLSESQVLESEWKNQLLLAKSAAATARLRSAELAIAQQRLKDTEIRAPIPTLYANEADRFYRVSERSIAEGTMLRVGTEVMKLVLGETLKLKLAVPEAYGTAVQVGQKVRVFASSNEQPSEGVVARISPTVDRATRTFLVEVEVPDLDGSLKPGGFAKAEIRIAVSERATTVPLAGLYSFAGINKIFLVDQDVAREVQVTLGEQAESWIEITSPALPSDAVVITSGQRMLSDGKRILVRESVDADDALDAKANSDEALSTVGHKQ